MARSRFTLGTRYKRNGEVFIVHEVLLEGALLVENQSFGGLIRTTQAELSAAWACGEISFEIYGSNTRNPGDTPLVTDFTIADFERLPTKWRAEARRRLDIIRPLLKLPPEDRTRKYIDEYVASLRAAQASPSDSANSSESTTEKRQKGRRKGQVLGQAISHSSLEIWMNDFINSGCDLRSLVPGYHRYKGKGKSRLDAEDEKTIRAVLEECKKSPSQRRARDVRSTIINRIVDNQGKRPAEELPSLSTLYRRIHTADFASILRRQRSQLEKHAQDQVFPASKPTRIMERVEIDDTPLDFIVVDLEDRLPIGRPTLTYAIDAYSGMPYGFYVGFEPPSYLTVQACLYHGILPKPDCQQIYGTKHSWPAYGLPETLIVDNGQHYAGLDLDYACEQLGITLERMPVRKPWFKGRIESAFHGNNRGLIHMLPGTTFSNVLERGDYDSFRHACISLEGFMQLLHIFLLDEYAIDWHDGCGKRGGVPVKLWEESMLSGYIPCLHHNIKDLRTILYPGEMRTIQPSGIDFKTLRYQNHDLASLRSYLESQPRKEGNQVDEEQGESHKAKVHIKYNPLDLSTLYVYDPRPGYEDWLPVPAVDQEYANGLSIHKHKVIRSYILRQKKTIDIYELAATKKHIQEIVEREYDLTKKGRGRKKAARYLGIGAEIDFNHISSNSTLYQAQIVNTPTEMEKEQAQNDASINSEIEVITDSEPASASISTKKRRKKKDKSDNTSTDTKNVSVIQETESGSSDKVSWGGDYELL